MAMTADKATRWWVRMGDWVGAALYRSVALLLDRQFAQRRRLGPKRARPSGPTRNGCRPLTACPIANTIFSV